tara:strand:+ start:8177 stop:8452 length:276 start_codon:yes stop_codon:yes gene_type:complete
VEILNIINEFGLPVSMVIACFYFINKQSKWIQEELEEDMEQSFNRLEKIQIELINQQKKTQMELTKVRGYIEGIEDILTRLTGNGLSGKKK